MKEAVTHPTPFPERQPGDGRSSALDATRGDAAAFPDGVITTLAAIRRRDAVYRRLLAVSDVASLVLALWLGASAVGGARLELGVLAALPALIMLAKLLGLYDRDENRIHKGTIDELPSLLHLATLTALLSFLAQGALVSASLGRLELLVIWASLLASLLLGRALARGIAARITEPERCLVVGNEAAAGELARGIEVQGLDAEVVSVLTPGGPGAQGDLATDDLASRVLPAIAEQRIHRVILASAPWDPDELLHAIGGLKESGVKVSVLAPISRITTLSFEVDPLPGMALLGMRRFEISRSSRIVKRGFDLAASTLILLLLAPLLAAIAVAIKLDSWGPVLFRQRRVGKGGAEFEMLKFRSMVLNADQRRGELRPLNEAVDLFKICADPRVTAVGRLIRRWSLDELPQLVNVARGEMSLVGPRPLIPEEDRRIHGVHRRRVNVRPGMTGHWQILGSWRIPLDEMVILDYIYVANWSIWEDLKLLARTIPFVISRRGV